MCLTAQQAPAQDGQKRFKKEELKKDTIHATSDAEFQGSRDLSRESRMYLARNSFSLNPFELSRESIPQRAKDEAVLGPVETRHAKQIVVDSTDESRFFLMEDAPSSLGDKILAADIFKDAGLGYSDSQELLNRFRARLKKNKWHTYKFYSVQNFINYLRIKVNNRALGENFMKLDVLNTGQGSANLIRYANKRGKKGQAVFSDLGVDIRNIADFIRHSSLAYTYDPESPIYTIISHGHADHTAYHDSASSQEVAEGLKALIAGRLAKSAPKPPSAAADLSGSSPSISSLTGASPATQGAPDPTSTVAGSPTSPHVLPSMTDSSPSSPSLSSLSSSSPPSSSPLPSPEAPLADRDYAFVILATGSHELRKIKADLEKTFSGIKIVDGTGLSADEDEHEEPEEKEKSGVSAGEAEGSGSVSAMEMDAETRVTAMDIDEEGTELIRASSGVRPELPLDEEEEYNPGAIADEPGDLDEYEDEDEDEPLLIDEDGGAKLEEIEDEPSKGVFDYLKIYISEAAVKGGSPAESKKYNEDSSIAKVEFNKTQYILPGDAPLEEVRRVVEEAKKGGFKVVLVSSHHGSKTGNDEALLRQSDILIVSSGWDNVHGLPSTEGLFAKDERFHRGRRQFLTGTSVLGKDGADFYNTAGFNRTPGSIVVKSGMHRYMERDKQRGTDVQKAVDISSVYTKQHAGRIFIKTFSGSHVKRELIIAIESIVEAMEKKAEAEQKAAEVEKCGKMALRSGKRVENPKLKRLSLCFMAICRKLNKRMESGLYSRLNVGYGTDMNKAYASLMRNPRVDNGRDEQRAFRLFPSKDLETSMDSLPDKDATDDIMSIYLEAQSLIQEMETSVKSFRKLDKTSPGSEPSAEEQADEKAVEKNMAKLKAEILLKRDNALVEYLMDAMDDKVIPGSLKRDEPPADAPPDAAAALPSRISLDGDCLYNAVSEAGALGMSARELRNMAYDWLRANRNSQAVVELLNNYGSDGHTLLAVIQTSGRWADSEGDLSVVILASALNRTIRVVCPGNNAIVNPLAPAPPQLPPVPQTADTPPVFSSLPAPPAQSAVSLPPQLSGAPPTFPFASAPPQSVGAHPVFSSLPAPPQSVGAHTVLSPLPEPPAQPMHSAVSLPPLPGSAGVLSAFTPTAMPQQEQPPQPAAPLPPQPVRGGEITVYCAHNHYEAYEVWYRARLHSVL